MWSTAKIDKLTLAIETQGIMSGQTRLDVFDLECLLHVAAQLDRLIAIERKLLEWLGQFNDFGHLGFNLGKVIFVQFLGQVEIIIKAIGNGRAEGQRNIRIKPHDGSSHNVRGGVTQNVQCLWVFFGKQPQRYWRTICKRLQCARGVHHQVTDLGGNNCFGQSRTNLLGDRKGSCIVWMGNNCSVGQ